MLPYTAPELLADTQAALFDLITADAENSGNGRYLTAVPPDTVDPSPLIDSIRFYISLNMQPPNIQERYRRGMLSASPCRITLYAVVEAK